MIYGPVVKAVFIKRPNRFIAHVLLDGREEIVHVKNTGRCREILKEGTTVILEEAQNLERKTRYSLIAGYKGDTLINIDSQVPNTVVCEAIWNKKLKEFKDPVKLKREAVYGNSRFDIYYETESRKGFIEVKGATLETGGTAMFPDAPTLRGSKHVYEMIKASEEGYEGYIFFLIQMRGVKLFVPNKSMDPEFTQALALAKERGIKILAYDSCVSESEITIGGPVEIAI